MPPLLQVNGLTTHITTSRGVVRAVEDVSFHLEAGETLGLVGESGCGKSMTGLSLMGLLPPGGSILEGSSVLLDDRELVGLPEREMRRVRGNDIAMVFQDPMTSLNPTKTIGHQVAEAVLLHRGCTRAEAAERAAEVLGLVGMPHPRERLGDYPHQLSGGLRQRVLIAMALASEPRAADRRRADHRAGRHHPGADPRPAGRPARPARHGDDPHHPRHGRHRRATPTGST